MAGPTALQTSLTGSGTKAPQGLQELDPQMTTPWEQEGLVRTLFQFFYQAPQDKVEKI